MLTHVVLFTLRADAGPDAAARLVGDALAQLTTIPGVSNLSAGRVLQSDSDFDVALAMQFEDAAGLDAYRVHPIHQAYVAYLETVVGQRQAYDFENGSYE